MSRSDFLRFFISAIVAVSSVGYAAESVALIREGDRIVVVGDSITGQSAGQSGYVTLMKEGLAAAHVETKTTVTPLGGSGQTVGSWRSVEKQSREKEVILDVKGIDVKATLDGGAEVLIVMLGMNNVLRPDVENTSESIDKWAADYRELVGSLQARTKARVVAVATPTMCTEDESSAKNQLMDAMSGKLIEIAEAEKWIVLPVREGFRKLLQAGRIYQSEFHLTSDYVHPNGAGHLAIAMAMLDGLGEKNAAKVISDKRLPEIFRNAAGKLPALSYSIEPAASLVNVDEDRFKVRFWLTSGLPRTEIPNAEVQLMGPKGWRISPAGIKGSTGEFTIEGQLDRLENNFKFLAQDGEQRVTKEMMIAAPWVIGIGNAGSKGWSNASGFKYDSAEGRFAIDSDISAGRGLDQSVAKEGWERAPVWRRYVASVNYTGGSDPGSVDLAAVGWFGTFDVAYGVRWIFSPVERRATLEIGSDIFAGENFVSVSMNGTKTYESSERKGTVEVMLQKGWNVMAFKGNHLSWQWQFKLQLIPAAGDDLSDLRYSVVPH